MSSRYSKSSLSKLNGNINTELLRLELYSIVTDVFLSKEHFNKNKDIATFIDSINFKYGDYLFKSRTLLLARILRDIKEAEKQDLLLITKNLQTLLFNNIEPDTKTKAKSSKNYVDSIMEQFKRGSEDE
ncbi:hypothetical protein COM04_03185 [Bacillus wiedmannii]|uniref:hypothetical protein n=1 Tax=Bacillus TaxID=1386 RepID=UPI000BF15E09|nr:hypothetical protein [Bacillus wiedmannii]MCP9277016.1 hypothetical protein [Bacillus wiedmannii]PEO96990.1 hypothetical protein CN554_14525 [Bacillus wiedmannii]PEP75638.1 hypothetical protein CN573_09665 [Bacillus wiedmannii]PGC00355.1 hypothetical protein COM04_03185 [Bacillus wiedmannii]HDR7866550.1 hypothetical protein [Bacillus wiedmannii]